ncbi:hypothetical protein HK103_002334 [Boothiomyces macroporosus]|uniref:Uncharacterized protein n=1 Tax=Boothiomyces macroporosus TaxID=261099 RepID=A0AAD5UNA9_9FUNG|nr:hypothetical protein HK103_002311 [Boothiomyces macroporosus]KAJ3259431.1 hypothetical protein HK103_002334 [Boothiomyces macroporosus]
MKNRIVVPAILWRYLKIQPKHTWPTLQLVDQDIRENDFHMISKIHWVFPSIRISAKHSRFFQYLPAAHVVEVVVCQSVDIEVLVCNLRKLISNYRLTSANPNLLSYLDIILEDGNLCQSIRLSDLSLGNSLNLLAGIQCKNLVELRLIDCGLRGEDLQCLGKTITNLTLLDLHANRIMDTGSLYLSKLLPNSKLTYLNVEMNGIGRTGLRNLCKALPSSKITDLKVNFNDFDSSAYQYLLQVLPQTRLEILDIYRILSKDLQMMFINNCAKSNLSKATVYIKGSLLEQFAILSNTRKLDEFCFFLANDYDCNCFGDEVFKFKSIKLNFGKYVTIPGIKRALSNSHLFGITHSIGLANIKLGSAGLEGIVDFIGNIEPLQIDLSNCELDCAAIGILKTHLSDKTKEILLHGNYIGAKSADMGAIFYCD